MPRTCERCGRAIPSDRELCICRSGPLGDQLSARDTILLTTLLALVAAFAITAVAARFYHDRRRDLAEFWFGQGTTDLGRGRASAALSDLQTALIYARQDVSDAQQQAYSLNLAQALVANHRLDEAHAYLLDLWQNTPDSARLNLELAHLSAAMGNDADAQRYYANAIYGIWQGSPEQVQKYQRDTQLEFCRYLIDRGETTSARSVLLAVAASLPRDPELHTQVGGMMLEAGDGAQALKEYQQALEIDRRDHDGLVGAGLASFALGDDRGAVRYLGQASREKPKDGQAVSLGSSSTRDLSVAMADLALDTAEPGLGAEERAERATQAAGVAKARLEQCAESLGVSLPTPTAKQRSSPSPAASASSTGPSSSEKPAPDDMSAAYAQALKIQSSAREAGLERNSQLVDSLMKLVFGMESAATAHCGAPTGVEDQALARLAARYTGQDHE
jgi:tetratricopeptide (TPR) repeat protein